MVPVLKYFIILRIKIVIYYYNVTISKYFAFSEIRLTEFKTVTRFIVFKNKTERLSNSRKRFLRIGYWPLRKRGAFGNLSRSKLNDDLMSVHPLKF